VARSPNLPLLAMDSTVSEETGPVFGHSLIGPLDNNLILNYTRGGAPAVGERILVHGRVLDENARAVPNALVEIWQANAGGRYRHVKDTYFAPLDPNFGGCGRTLTGDDGYYQFLTIRPGAYPWPNRANDWRPMHIHLSIFGHAFGQRLITQMYFEGDPLIDLCPIVATIKDRGQIERLVAPLDMAAAKPMDFLAYKFDIVLRGSRQTMFENRRDGM
jgi:protocatechuate 3,4-dioxygenase beta subunit